MKKYFKTRMEAIEWIASQTENEGEFEVFREDLTFNFIYTGSYFIEPKVFPMEVLLLKREDER